MGFNSGFKGLITIALEIFIVGCATCSGLNRRHHQSPVKI